MNKEMILERIDSLVKLCEKTEPDYKDSAILFTGQYVAAQEMFAKMSRIILEDDNDDMSIRSREDIVVIMKESNLIYKMRKKMMKWMEEGKDLNSEAKVFKPTSTVSKALIIVFAIVEPVPIADNLPILFTA